VLTLPPGKARALEIGFAAVFSAVILVVFYALISMNGLVLGNDPAVHLERAQMFLQTGKIPLANLGWTPPLYQILLATLISFTGATSLEQMIFLVKALAAIIDWLLFFSVYIIGAKFFGRRVGAVAAVLLFMCFPMYEINLWGGYTSVLGISFMVLLLLYLPSAVKSFGYVLVTFVVAFSVVLSHQLAAFLAVIILAPVILVMLVQSRGRYLKALIALILGGGVAFFLYYIQAAIPYLGGAIEHLFFLQKAMLYQVPATTLNAFMVNFGFVFVVALCGVFVVFFSLRIQKKLTLFLILFLSLLVPFVLAESYLFGLYLPFQWFIYYLLPPLTVFAAAFLVFALGKVSAFYHKYDKTWRKLRLRAVAVVLAVLVASVFLFRFGVVYGKINEAAVYYSTSDIKGYEAGVWLSNNFPGEATAVVTEIPGFWFQVFSGKNVIAATNPIIERNIISETVLDLSYELEHPQTLVRTFDAKGDFSDEISVSINDVWTRVSYSSGAGDFVSYRIDGVDKHTALSNLTRENVFEDGSPPKLVIRYFNDEIAISKTISFQNDSYPINVDWTLSAVKGEVSNVVLYVSVFFDLRFSFEKAYLPGILDWENPWDRPTTSQGSDWATVEFSPSTITDNYVGVYDEKDAVTFALNFEELPEWGNVGALANRQIDAIRFNYSFDKIDLSNSASLAYQVLTFSKSSYPNVQMPSDLKSLFAFKVPDGFEVESRDYKDYIRENDIKFIVYDKNQLDTKMINSKLLELIYSNDRYVIFKINDSA
jgi:hypothetical protein